MNAVYRAVAFFSPWDKVALDCRSKARLFLETARTVPVAVLARMEGP